MNCSDVLELAPLYLAGDLDHARAANVISHLQACRSCASELGQQQDFDRLFRASLLSETVDSQQVERVERRVRQLVTREHASRVLRRRIFAMAALAAVILLGALGIRKEFPRHVPVYAAAARDHRFEIIDKQPRKWLTDQAAIQTLAAGQGVSKEAVAAIAPPGYHLAQGKFCRLDGRMFLHLVYVSSFGNFSVFLRRNDAKSSGSKVIAAETQGSEHVAGFEDNQLSTLIVTDQSDAAALQLARSIAALI